MQTIQSVTILGVTGFLGRGLPTLLVEKSMTTVGVSRSGKGQVPNVERWTTPENLNLSGQHAVINLAGEPVDQRWNDRTRRLFHESRVGVTDNIVQAIAKLPAEERPKVLINASAVGFYGDRGDETLTESSRRGQGYLADLCSDWEDAAVEAESLGVRVVRLRIGVVLGKGGRAFEKLNTIFKFGIGGRLGSGRQWMPWIHVEDLRAAIVHSLVSTNLAGPVNGVAPQPERNRDFTRKLATALHRPAIFPSPAFALKLALGDFSSALLGSQRVVPSALAADGFQFKFPKLETAFTDLTRS
jgi:uncharacterized protein (TIGR01777 family)